MGQADQSPKPGSEGNVTDGARAAKVPENGEAPAAAEEATTAVDEAEQQGAEASETLDMDDHGQLSVEELVSNLSIARAEATNYKDLALRAEAELQNVRRRAQRDVESAHRYALERFLTRLLPIVDSLEKTLEVDRSAQGSAEAVIDGVGLCLKMLLDEFHRENVKQLDPTGEPFDPKFHEALTMLENPSVEPNTVLNVYQKGYLLNDRLVRPAKVIVARAPAG